VSLGIQDSHRATLRVGGYARKIWRILRFYLLAVGVVVGITMLRLALEQEKLVTGEHFLLYSLGVVLVALWGGFWPGVVATILSTVAIDYFFLPPLYAFTIHRPEEYFPLFMYVVQGTLISWLAESKMHMVQTLFNARVDLEKRVERRTTELRQANAALERQARKNERMAEDLRRYAEQLQRTHSELQEFASIASLDLQAPLRKILEYSERVRSEHRPALGETGQEQLQRLQASALRMSNLLPSLVAFSRVNARSQPFLPVELGRIFRDVMEDMHDKIEEVNALVQIGELPTISADPLQIRKLFENLLSNAIKFRREKVPLSVRVSGRILEPAISGISGAHAAMCEIQVADNGIGFDEKHLDRLFAIFQRLHGRGTYEGTGVGLAICRKVCELHGGLITAKSREGEGSTFIVRLPIEQMSRTMEPRPRSDG